MSAAQTRRSDSGMRLFNLVNDAPDWREFVQLELAGCRTLAGDELEGQTEGLQPAVEAEFFTVYARRPAPDGTCEAITDIPDALTALAVAGELALLSGLPVIVHPSLAGEVFTLRVWRIGDRRDTLTVEQFTGSRIEAERRLSRLWDVNTPADGTGWRATATDSNRHRFMSIGW